MVTKFGQFKKLKCREGSQLCKLSQLCYHFLSNFENENNIFISPAIVVRNSLTNQFYQKNWRFCIFSKKKLWQFYIRISILVIPDHISSNGCPFLTAGFLVNIRSINLGMDRQSEWLLCTLSELHIQAQREATFWQLGSWCTERERSVNLGMDG